MSEEKCWKGMDEGMSEVEEVWCDPHVLSVLQGIQIPEMSWTRLSCLNSGWCLMGSWEPSEVLPVHGSAPWSSGRQVGIGYIKPKTLFFPWPTTLPTACHISVGLLNPPTLIAHSCDLESGNCWLGQTNIFLVSYSRNRAYLCILG